MTISLYFKRVSSFFLTVFVSLILASDVEGELRLVAGEFQIDTFPRSLAVAATDDGSFLVVWAAGENNKEDIFGKRFENDGTPSGTEFVVSTYTTGGQFYPAVAADRFGNYVVAWVDYGRDGDRSGIFGQRVSSSGTLAGAAFLINTYTTGSQSRPDIAAGQDGSFTVVWDDYQGASSVRAQRFDVDGIKIGAELTLSEGSSPRVGVDAVGNMVVAWAPPIPPGGNRNMLVQRFRGDGSALGPPVLSVADDSYSDPPEVITGDVAVAPSGDFVVAWSGYDHTGFDNSCDVRARRYDSTGGQLGAELVVSDATAGAADCLQVSVEMADDDSSVVAWTHVYNYTFPSGSDLHAARDGDSLGVFAQRYDANGVPDSKNLRLNRVRLGLQHFPSIALDSNGNAVAVWRDGRTLGGLTGQRYCLDDDVGCDRCPGSDDSLDGDGDGIADGCDMCTNVAGQQSILSSRVVVFENEEVHCKVRDTVRARGKFSLGGPPGGFATLAPDIDGVAVRFAAPDGVLVAETSIPGGVFAGSGTEGWKRNRTGTKWMYLDKRPDGERYAFCRNVGGRNGIEKLLIKDKASLRYPNRVSITVYGKDLVYPLSVEDEAVNFSIRLGGQAAAEAGLCGETELVPDDCKFKARQKQTGRLTHSNNYTISCRR